MQEKSTQFDEKDALLAADAVRVRAPTLQKKRIRKRYARQYEKESRQENEADEEETLNGGTEGKTKKKPEGESEAARKTASGNESFNTGKSTFFGQEDAGAETEADTGISVSYRHRRFPGGAEAGENSSSEETRYRKEKQDFYEDEVKARMAEEDITEAEIRRTGLRKDGSVPDGTDGSSHFHDIKADETLGRGHFQDAGQTEMSLSGGRDGIFYTDTTSQAIPKGSSFQKEQIKKVYNAPAGTARASFLTKLRDRWFAERTIRNSQKAAAIITEGARKHPVMILVVISVLIITLMVSAIAASGVSVIGEVVSPSVTATSYSAEDEDLRGAESDYQALEEELRARCDNLEAYYPGYTNYELSSSEVGHDPYRLAALLTVLHERFSRNEVQQTLRRIFNAQYQITTEDTTGGTTTRTVRVGESLGTVVTSGYCNCSICCGRWAGGATASGVYPQAQHTIAVDSSDPIVPMGTKVVMNGIEYTVEDTGPLNRYGVAFDVYYDDHQTAQNHGHQRWEAYIADDNGTESVTVTVVNTEPTLSVTLQNLGIDYAAYELLDADLLERYHLLVEMKGNRTRLFPDYDSMSLYEGLMYAPPGSALSDVQFANIYYEAIKYLGIKYVWGGETPEGGFDCSGFVSYVINHCGDGWNFGRLTAEEWRRATMVVSPADAKPGDLIFFQGTYDTRGASHIGIYLGDGMMIHAGHPVQIASINTSYFQAHFLSFGRIPA
jgi:cell wall-associated NlpC family hydrolase